MRYFIFVFFVLMLLTVLIKAEANVVHTVYFQPADQPAPTKEDIREVKNIMLKTQAFYSRELKRLENVPKTFKLERDDAGLIVVHIVKGKHNLKVYSNFALIRDELPPEISDDLLWRETKIRVVFLAGAKDIAGVAGMARRKCSGNICNHIAYIPTNVDLKIKIIQITIHEVGHTFGLVHNSKKPPREKTFVMVALTVFDLNNLFKLKDFLLDADETRLLNDHPFFNPGGLSIPNYEVGNLSKKMWVALKVQNR